MQALVYHRSVLRYLAAGLLSRFRPRHFWGGILPLRLKNIDRPCPEGWLRLKVLLCGICGSDLNLLRGSESVLMEPYASFPAVMGHEVIGEVLEASPDGRWTPGMRVAVNPLLPCAVRGVPLCRYCEKGQVHLCERFTTGDLAPGVVAGYHAEVGGGFAEFLCAHPSCLVALPDGLDLKKAVLTDSLASALQPALDHFPDDSDTVLIYGAGIIAQHLVRCLRAFGSRAKLIMVARHGFQKDLAEAGGADDVLLRPNRRALARAVGARRLRTTLGGGNLEGGADGIFDCVGSTHSLQESLLLLRGRGKLVMVGTAGKTGPLDLSSLWFRELTVVGSNCYSTTRHNGEERRTYERAVELLAGVYPTEGLLTHVYPLTDYCKAFQAAMDKNHYQSMKVALNPQGNAR